jgi:cytochrome d ubiquinol oxidase subunit I
MTNLLAARSQMAISLAFHILFAVAGIAMPLMMVIAEWLWWRSGEEAYLEVAKRWARGTAILFAVGAVSGTVLSLELGLLWPHFMQWAGAIIGMPFSLEGFAFFTEAIFLGIYFYGWRRVSTPFHLFAGVIVILSGVASAIFVVIANAWMNTPAGFSLRNGQPVNIDPIAAMLNRHAFPESIHMVIAAFAAIGFAVAGIHAHALLRDPKNLFHQRAFTIALWVGAIAALLQPFSGDELAQRVARNQPVKLAAFEGHFRTEKDAPLHIGGFPDMDARTTRYAIRIPYGLSLLAFHDPHAEVKGLDDYPREDWPNVPIVHIAFQIMVGAGSLMMLLGLIGLYLRIRKRDFSQTLYLKAMVAATPLGFIAIEAGWTVTEVGRQPWIIYGVMRTADALTPMPGLVVPFLTFTTIYIFLALIVIWLLRHMVLQSPSMRET